MKKTNKKPVKNPKKTISKNKIPATKKRLTVKQWAEIRALWETGNYTFLELSKQFNVAVSTLKKRSSSENWNKKSNKEQIEKEIQDTTIQMLVKAGLPKQKYIDIMVKRFIKTATYKNIKRPVYLKDEITGEQSIKNDMYGNPVIMETSQRVLDNAIMFKYGQEIGKMIGVSAPPLKPVEAKDQEEDSQEIPVQSYIPKVIKK